MICCIPSKGRPSTTTHKLFDSAGIQCFHFVEPQDFDAYSGKPNVINIGQNNSGVSFVRNYIFKWAKQNKFNWIIICDDDVTSFGYYDTKNYSCDASIWKEIMEKAKNLPFEIVGINYRQHAWHEKNNYSINKKFAEVCAAFNVSRIKWEYKPDTKEDRDFALQTIKNGNGILRFNKYFFNCPDVGTNSGGLYELYKQKRDSIWAAKLVQEWAPFAKIVHKNGRIDAKIEIAEFAKHHGKVVK
jgi:hypothetical protein